MYIKNLTRLSVLIVAGVVIFTGCDKNSAPVPLNQCDTTNTTFSKLYTRLLADTDNIDDTFYDARVHSYTFKVSSKEIICKIGYQNLGIGSTQPDLIEIYDSTTNSLLYTGSHFFDSTKISYISINPVAIEVGHSYTIKRTRTYITYLQELIGRMVRSQNRIFPFPATFGNLSITSSSFYQSSPTNGVQSAGIPYIDLVFE